MHSIKKAARREAWYRNEGDPIQTYNPFGRTRVSSKKPTDEESRVGQSLQYTQTEDNAPSPVEEARRKSNEIAQRGFGPPAKASTFAGSSTTETEIGREIRPGNELIGSSDGSKSSTEKDVKFNSEADGVIDESVGPTDAANQPRKRKLRKFLPWKSKKDKEADALNGDDEKDEKKKTVKNPNITFMSQFKAVFYSWVNILLPAVPVGIALEYAGVNKVVVFVVNFIAIIPLAGMLSYATEELAMYIGEVLGGLLNASFGNAVELIVGIIALTQGQIIIVQTSLIGSMLSNLLLVMGMCFFFGGLRRIEQLFNITVAQTAASLLALAIGGLIIPTAFKQFASNDTGVAPVSRGTSVFLLVTYGCYLFFQLRTHVEIYNETGGKTPKKPSARKQRKKEEGEAKKAMATTGGTSAAILGGGDGQQYMAQEDVDQPEVPQLTKIGALVTLAGSTVLVALCAEFMVSAIGDVAGSVSPEFIGLILLPIVGNAAEHATAVTVAIKDKMDLAIGVAVGSSLQIALLVLPLMVMFNWWGVGQSPNTPDMTLAFNPFQVIVLFIAIVVVNYLISDGKSHWLEGIMLMITYLIIALSAWYYPVSQKLA